MMKPEAIQRPTPLQVSVLLVLSAIVAGSPQPASGAPLSCGQQPKIDPAELTQRIAGDVTSKADLIRQAKPNAGLRALVGTQRRDLRQKFASVEPETLDSYLLWATCQTISNDPAESTTQKFDEYANLYRLLTEPIRAPAHAE